MEEDVFVCPECSAVYDAETADDFCGECCICGVDLVKVDNPEDYDDFDADDLY